MLRVKNMAIPAIRKTHKHSKRAIRGKPINCYAGNSHAYIV